MVHDKYCWVNTCSLSFYSSLAVFYNLFDNRSLQKKVKLWAIRRRRRTNQQVVHHHKSHHQKSPMLYKR
jgi:hypothetical protein